MTPSSRDGYLSRDHSDSSENKAGLDGAMWRLSLNVSFDQNTHNRGTSRSSIYTAIKDIVRLNNTIFNKRLEIPVRLDIATEPLERRQFNP